MQYYKNPEIQQHIYNHLAMGNTGLEYESILEQGEVLRLGREGPEYIAYTTPETARGKKSQGRPSPARSVKTWTLPQLYEEHPQMELFSSQWQTDTHGQENTPVSEREPFRVPLIWDIEYYNFANPDLVLVNQLDTYYKLEEVYDEMASLLQYYGVPFVSTMSGRGYHFITSATPEIYDSMLTVSGYVSTDLQEHQTRIPAADGVSKRDRPIPPKVEQLFRASCRLQQFLFLQAMANISNSPLPVHISDVGNEGISMDNTAMVRNAGTAVMGVLGSMYLKPWLYGSSYSDETLRETKQLYRIARSNSGNEPHGLQQLIWQRQDPEGVLENLNIVGSGIPEGNTGLLQLIEHYKSSRLYELYLAMDSVDINPRPSWEKSYRADNYGYLHNAGQGIPEIMGKANPLLLTPEGLDYFINTMFDSWGGEKNLGVAKHVQGLLQAIYEDSRFNWLGRFTRHDLAGRHAQGWVEMILAKRIMLGR
jgi:hypothetical protein